MPSSYALGEKAQDFINSLVASGRYNSKSEVVRDALRLLEEQEQMRQVRMEELRQAFREGIESGNGQPADKVFDRLKAKYRDMASDQ